MASNLFTSISRFERFTDIGVQFNDGDIENAVVKAQKLDLETILGKNLYDALDGHITGFISGTPIPTLYATLLNDFVEDYLINVAYYYLLETIWISPRNNSLSLQNAGPGNTPVDKDIYQLKRQSVESEIEQYRKNLQEFLEYNYSDYPELSEQTNLPSERADLDGGKGRTFISISGRNRDSNGDYRGNRYGSNDYKY